MLEVAPNSRLEPGVNENPPKVIVGVAFDIEQDLVVIPPSPSHLTL